MFLNFLNTHDTAAYLHGVWLWRYYQPGLDRTQEPHGRGYRKVGGNLPIQPWWVWREGETTWKSKSWMLTIKDAFREMQGKVKIREAASFHCPFWTLARRHHTRRELAARRHSLAAHWSCPLSRVQTAGSAAVVPQWTPAWRFQGLDQTFCNGQQ